jgi:hypothetical protein
MKDLLPKARASKIAASGAKPAPLTTAASEVIEVPRVCAMFDKPWIARYVRGARGLFRLMDTVKPESGNAAGAGQGSAARDVILTSSETSRDSEPERCPWCGVKGALILCESCGAWVCRSQVTKREDGEHFRCRASCGSEGTLTKTTEGYKGRLAQAPSFSPALPEPKKTPALPQPPRVLIPPAPKNPPLPGKASPQIGPGNKLRLKP